MLALAQGLEAMTPLEQQFEDLRARYPGASLQSNGGMTIVTVPSVVLPQGWSRSEVTVHFAVPTGYPQANPDCFHVDEDLRLGNGQMPQNSAMQGLAGVGNTLWFSWHLQTPWKPGRDTLLTWMGVIMNRFAHAL